jgi:hypothetical protein
MDDQPEHWGCLVHAQRNAIRHRRGRIVTVLNQDKAAVLFGLEMAVQKYGTHIACDGSVEWKRMVTKVAAQQGISVQFTDPEMQHALRLLQRLANPRQRQQERGGR